MRVAMQSANNWLHVHSWNDFPVRYSPFTIHHIHATNLNLNIIWFRFYSRLLRVYIVYFLYPLMGTPSIKMCWFDAILQAFYDIDNRIWLWIRSSHRRKGHFAKKLLPNFEINGTNAEISRQIRPLAIEEMKNNIIKQETVDFNAAYIHSAFSYTM